MSNELTKKDSDLLDVVTGTDLGDIIKPLVNEIHLFDTYVAGTTHLEDKTVLDQIHLDDKLSLVREENEFDEKAIVIKTADGRKLGYVPEKDNLVFSRLMDAGKLLTARINTQVVRIRKSSMRLLQISADCSPSWNKQ